MPRGPPLASHGRFLRHQIPPSWSENNNSGLSKVSIYHSLPPQITKQLPCWELTYPHAGRNFWKSWFNFPAFPFGGIALFPVVSPISQNMPRLLRLHRHRRGCGGFAVSSARLTPAQCHSASDLWRLEISGWNANKAGLFPGAGLHLGRYPYPWIYHEISHLLVGSTIYTSRC